MVRIIVDVLLLISFFFLPWWAVLFLAAVATFWFPRFYEFIFFALAIDLLYAGDASLFYVPLPVTFFTIIVFVALAWIKERVRL